MLVLGWLVGLPVPFMIAWGPSWGWVIAANALLGINQGFAWSMTVIMKVDLVGPKSRGLAVGLNEFAGYLSVGITAFLTGYIAERYGCGRSLSISGWAMRLLGSFFRSSWCVTRATTSDWRSPATVRSCSRSDSGRSSAAPRSATAICSRHLKRGSSIISMTV